MIKFNAWELSTMIRLLDRHVKYNLDNGNIDQVNQLESLITKLLDPKLLENTTKTPPKA